MKHWLIEHPNVFGRLYITVKKLHISFVEKWLESILDEQRKKGLILAKNTSGKTIEKGLTESNVMSLADKQQHAELVDEIESECMNATLKKQSLATNHLKHQGNEL